MSSGVRVVLLLVAVAQLAGCAARPAVAPAPAPAHAAPRDLATAASIEHVLAGAHRSAEDRARDADRHPLETLLFFGIKPDMTVVETWPGAGGWYTEVLAPLLAEHGRLYAAQLPPDPGSPYTSALLASFNDKLKAHPELYGRVAVTALGPGVDHIAPPASADMVLSFLNLHAWINLGIADPSLGAIYRALKPGGILGVVEHRGDPSKPQDPRATSGYVNEKFAIELITRAGFELVGRAEINGNPKDSKDYEQGVWVLPPDYRQGNRDRDKFTAIGESDRFTLKFRKP